jgi:uncharacterized protein HemX
VITSETKIDDTQTVNKKSFSLLQISGLFIAALLIISAIAGYYLWQFVNDTNDSITQNISDNKTKNASLSISLNETDKTLNNKIRSLISTQSELSNSVHELLSKSTHMRKDWLVSEAQYLVKLAATRLALEGDIDTAITALTNADSRLLEAGDPGLLLLRQEISNKLLVLKALPDLDISGMSIHISSVIQQIDTLPLITPDPDSFKQARQTSNKTTTQNNEDGSPIDWKEVTTRVVTDITSLIRIRKHEQAIQPLISPEQRFFLVQNLKLQLEQARTALLHQQQDIFHERLAISTKWIKEYFDISKSATQSVITVLSNLNNKTLTHQTPDLSYALKMFGNYQAGIRLKKKAVISQNKKKPTKKQKKRNRKVTKSKSSKKPVVKATAPKKPKVKKTEVIKPSTTNIEAKQSKQAAQSKTNNPEKTKLLKPKSSTTPTLPRTENKQPTTDKSTIKNDSKKESPVKPDITVIPETSVKPGTAL